MKNFILFFIGFIALNSFGQTKENNLVYNIDAVEIKPEFPGGNQKFYKYIAKNFNIPEEVTEKKEKQVIHVTFIIEKDGKLTDIKVIRDIGYGTKEKVEELLKNSPNWKPAELNGEKVRCHYFFPITINGTI
ncbi:energy transducer TonB [Flavobacterium macrobrachii]|uniref:Energy transducer TonB n=1 Tax=Flavobacterium macrobrachii TaxID=591204 RepID=A0ABS2CYM1_9FLAO|nr:energy transducer TonB [Flavobacterium macrobrachii]MBM6500063.1 energy transducer TonB [Flavobacterium macrobrachii]